MQGKCRHSTTCLTPAGPWPLVAGMHQALSNLTSQSATVPPNREAAIAAAVVAASVAAAEAPRLEPAPPLPLAAAAATSRPAPAGGVHPERRQGDQSCLDRSRGEELAEQCRRG